MSDVVQQIKDRISIVDVVSAYVELHKAGKNFKGKSPFSAEKTPSFYVSPDRGMYYCFSTSQGGDIFNFVQVMEGVEFKEALRILAEKTGVELVPEKPEKRSERERMYHSLDEATAFYQDCLFKEFEAEEYLKKRGVKPETVAKWRIGFAPGPTKHGWRVTKDYLTAKGYTKDELLKVGLIKKADAGNEPFDVFRDRVMFPLFESSGRVVAFSGRILYPDEKSPKYVNSPETELYKKSELLFGYDKAKNGIRQLGFSLIVEGQFDVVMCHQAGYGNTVAVSGTALTLHHVQLLERLSDKVVLALDADKAGINAMKKAADVMLRRGLDVKVAEMPVGSDPADLIASDVANFKKIVGKSVHVIEFFIHVLRRENVDDRAFKLKAQKEVYPFVLLLPSRVDQYSFAEIVARETKVPVDVVWHEIERMREQGVGFQEVPDTSGINIKNEMVGDQNYRTYLFLVGALEILPEKHRDPIKKELDSVLSIFSVSQNPTESELAGIIFNLEQQFAVLPELALQEELVSKLNQYKIGLIKGKLSELKRELRRVEEEKDDTALVTVLQSISKYEAILREPRYTVEDVFGITS